MKKLDEFGDDYHAEKIKLVDKEERRIAEILQEDVEFVANDSKKPKRKMKGGENQIGDVCLWM